MPLNCHRIWDATQAELQISGHLRQTLFKSFSVKQKIQLPFYINLPDSTAIFLQTVVNKIRNNYTVLLNIWHFFSAIVLSPTLRKWNQILHTVTHIDLITQKLPSYSSRSGGFESAHKCAGKQKFLTFPHNTGFLSHTVIWKSHSLHTIHILYNSTHYSCTTQKSSFGRIP